MGCTAAVAKAGLPFVCSSSREDGFSLLAFTASAEERNTLTLVSRLPRIPALALERKSGSWSVSRARVNGKPASTGPGFYISSTSSAQIQPSDYSRSSRTGDGCNRELVALRQLCQEGRLKEALAWVDKWKQQGARPSVKMYSCLLKACSKLKRVSDGKKVHDHLVKAGYKSNLFLNKTLVHMYAECGCLLDARRLFEELADRDVFSWNAVIAGYANYGKCEEAVNLYKQMLDSGVEPNSFTFRGVLKACSTLGDLDQARGVHADVLKCGMEDNVVVSDTILNMYSKCGSMKDARLVFDKMPIRTMVSWNLVIAGYVQVGQENEALALFEEMCLQGLQPDKFTFVSLFKACASLGALERGKQLHAEATKQKLCSNVFVASILIDMYGKCGGVEEARKVFDQLQRRDVVAWTAMISAYLQNEHGVQALALFWQMQQKGMKPDEVAFVNALKACASLEALDQGKQIHADVESEGYEIDAFLGSSLIEMYASCGAIESARQIFYEMKERDVACWNAMIAGCVQNKQNEEAIQLFDQMLQEGTRPDSMTVVSTLKACGNLQALEIGNRVYAEILKHGLEIDLFVSSTLVDLYSKCSSMSEAQRVFDSAPCQDVVLWGALLAGHAQQENWQGAFALFKKMQTESVKMDKAIFVCIFKLCAKLGTLEQGYEVYSVFRKSGLDLDVHLENALIDMLTSCGSMNDAEHILENSNHKSTFACKAMLAGYIKHGPSEKALDLFEVMHERGLEVDTDTFVKIFDSCARHKALEKGKKFYSYFVSSSTEQESVAEISIINMFGECGSTWDAQYVFDHHQKQDSAVWAALIAAYLKNGETTEGLTLLERMDDNGVVLDQRNVADILEACPNRTSAEQRFMSQLRMRLKMVAETQAGAL